jgi:hypothetical protein
MTARTTASVYGRIRSISLPCFAWREPTALGQAVNRIASADALRSEFTETLSALQGLIGRPVYVSVGRVEDSTPMTVPFSGVLHRAHEFSPEIAEYLDPALRDQDVMVFRVGEGSDPAWLFLVGERFERGWREGKLIGLEVGSIRVVMFPTDDGSDAG